MCIWSIRYVSKEKSDNRDDDLSGGCGGRGVLPDTGRNDEVSFL